MNLEGRCENGSRSAGGNKEQRTHEECVDTVANVKTEGSGKAKNVCAQEKMGTEENVSTKDVERKIFLEVRVRVKVKVKVMVVWEN